MRVLKFGGSSVGKPDRVRQVATIVAANVSKKISQVVIVSAFEGCTDTLLKIGHLAAKGDPAHTELLQQLRTRHMQALHELTGQAHKDSQHELQLMLEQLAVVIQGVFLLREASARTLDLIVSFGERLSAFILAATLSQMGVPAEYLDTRSVIVTDTTFGNARVNFPLTDLRLQQHFKTHNQLQIATGFIASTECGETTTLGRGGSDYTASILGAALAAEEIQIWTDVNGVMTADPRKVKEAFSVPMLTYEEAMELSHFGAKVIYAPTIQPALNKRIPIRVKNTFEPEFEGTIITNREQYKLSVTRSEKDAPMVISGISSVSAVSLLRVEGSGMVGVAGVAKRVFGALAAQKINVILISQASSEHSICFATSPDAAPLAKRSLEEEFQTEISNQMINSVQVENELCIVAVVGENMRSTPGISGKLFQSLGKNGINVRAIAQGSSELNISVVIERADEAKALNAIHDAFFLSQEKTVNLFIIGPGNVGATLLSQCEAQFQTLRADRAINLRLAGLANSKQMLFDPQGIPLASWESALAAKSSPFNLQKFIAQMKSLNLSSAVFVDCTASDEVASSYQEILGASINVVTANKRANAGSLTSYKTIRKAALKSNAKFFYETNVGAGLPIIGTLADLVSSGDEITRIDAVLSGTLSFIFNSYSAPESLKFSEIVLEAQKRGFTEPDPRDDLSGKDVARKLLILAREIGLELEERDIQVESLIPDQCKDAKSAADFLQALPNADAHFNTLKATAAKQGSVLRYIGRLENGRAAVSLQPIRPEHPFFALSGSDNIIALTTKRYHDRPLVVQGPGAGREVTAAGVFADIVRVASYLS